ncbi:MFS transporter [Sphingobium sufflavum]|uniref:MFS transporter n=1 Tax=Sphingobium sufflavum TaxID=1129547 RepID=UPI001F4623A0|nr:MFS transporter [Sphingobium sufflavum]MCE7796990.1 MFS transporter [Sphingobium sufflavum]
MAGNVAASADRGEVKPSDMRLVIAASSAGTIFEWYDFFIYGTLAGIIGKTFFPADNPTLQILLVWAGFAVGFGFRPLGAVLFGYLGDRLGRKYTFLATVILMGIATAGVGLIPSAESIGIAAPILVILLRVLQGLALGGEYGGAAIYVVEHAPAKRAGYFSSYIQASVVGGFVLSLIVVLSCKAGFSAEAWGGWAWRVPFILSLGLLAISLWMRLKLNESPVFQAMKEAGEISGNPIRDSFTYPGNKKRILVALFGVAAGLTVIWYTAMFTGLSFLKGPMRVEDTAAEIIVGVSALLGMGFFILAGHISDKVGRKTPVVIGYALTLLLLFPIFWILGAAANPGQAEAAKRAPVTVVAKGCAFDPFADKQASVCGRALGELSKLGVHYTVVASVGRVAAPGNAVGQPIADGLEMAIGGTPVVVRDAADIRPLLEARGYAFDKQIPPVANIAVIVGCLLALSALSGFTYGPVAALLAEMFPPTIRYSSLSIPYHIGTGYFGGFLPLISSYIVARTGDPYAGLWYTIVVVAVALVVALWGLRDDRDTATHPATFS